MLSHVEIEPSALIGVGLTLKGDGAISLMPVTHDEKPEEEF